MGPQRASDQSNKGAWYRPLPPRKSSSFNSEFTKLHLNINASFRPRLSTDRRHFLEPTRSTSLGSTFSNPFWRLFTNPLPATMSAPQKAPEVIEILSDSEPEDVVKDDLEDLPELLPEANDHDDQPLLRAAGIKYKTRDHDEEDDSEEDAEQEEDDLPDAPTRSTVSPRVLRSGKRVTIDTTESKSSSRRTKSSSSVRESEQHNEGEAFKTTLGRKHIKFDDSEQEEFVTPREGPMENPFESIKPAAQNGPGDESEEESDNEAPPEAVSTRVAEAESLKAAKAAAKAAEQYVKQSSYPSSGANYSLNQDKLQS